MATVESQKNKFTHITALKHKNRNIKKIYLSVKFSDSLTIYDSERSLPFVLFVTSLWIFLVQICASDVHMSPSVWLCDFSDVSECNFRHFKLNGKLFFILNVAYNVITSQCILH